MKTITQSRLLLLTLLFAASIKVNAQDNIEQIFRAGVGDANTYLKNYAEEAILSFNSGLGSGWYNTAKPHKTLGFDLTASISVATIPKSDLLFQFNPNDYANLELQGGGSSATLPTAFGGDANQTSLVIPANTVIENPLNGEQVTYSTEINFPAPDGLIDGEDFPIIGAPVPAIQLGIGLVKNTELKLRYVQDFGLIDDGSLSIIGVGVLHDIKQWIPGIKQLPFDISGFIGYTSLSADYQIDDILDSDFTFVDGDVEFQVRSTTFQAVASKKISILTPYLGIGYNIAGSTFKVKGQVSYQDGINRIELVDPIDLEFDNGSTARINAGFRIKLAILTLHAEYAIQKYNTLTAGVGISVR